LTIVVMGVAGSGKSTLGPALATALGCRFLDADELHPPANIAKMASGVPLDDEDRRPWLDALRAALDRWAETGDCGVLACSALTRASRRRLLGSRPGAVLILLTASPAVLKGRLAERRGHFMPAALLDSQIAALETPGPDEAPIVIDVACTPEEAARAALRAVLSRIAAPVGRAPRPPGPAPPEGPSP
jgi:gluconokinase